MTTESTEIEIVPSAPAAAVRAAPFNLKKTQPQGVCAAMRCKNACTDLLCDKHLEVWRKAGSPVLKKEATAPKGVSANGLDAETQELLLADSKRATTALGMAQQIPLDTPEQVELAIKIMNSAKASSKAWDEKRKERVAPLNATVKWINGMFNDVIDVYDSIAKTLNDRNSARLLKLEADRRDALRLVAANPAAAPAEAYAAAHADLSLPSNAGAARVRYEFRVVDEQAIPECLPTGGSMWRRVLDYDVIRTYIRTCEAQGIEPQQIPGLEITKSYSIAKGRDAA